MKSIRKKMISLIIYGIIFLISTIAFYFVNTSKAQNVIRLEVFVADQDGNVKLSNYDLKVQEEDGKYKTKLYPIQNGLIVKKYRLATEEEYENIKKIYKKQAKKEDKKERNNNEKNNDEDEALQREKRSLEKSSKEIELTEEQVKRKKIFLIAEYDSKEIDKKILYNKIISNSEDNTQVSISGYMPENAELSTKKKDINEVKEIIKNNFQDVNRDINLIAAYDIKIIFDEKEFEPEEFDEKAEVSITGVEGKNFNIWHIKNDDTIELIENKKEQEKIEFETEGFSTYAIELIEEQQIEEKPIEEKQDEQAENNVEEQQTNQEKNEDVNESSINQAFKEEGNSTENNNTTEDNNKSDEKENDKSKLTIKKAPRKAAARNLPDSTLEIDDYESDYYYYMGQNYTDNVDGTNSNKSCESNTYLSWICTRRDRQ